MAKNNGGFDDEEGFFESLMRHREHIPMPQSMSKLLRIILGSGVLLIVALVAWAVWPSGDRPSADSVPVVRADDAEYKVTPDEPGGMPIPNKDSTVFESMDSTPSGEGKVENLLEDSEQPMKKEEVFQQAESEPAPAPTAVPAPVAETPVEKVVAKEVEKPKEDIINTLKKEAGTDKPKPVAAKEGAKGSVYIQLAAVKSDADAKTKWTKLQSMYSSLKPLSMRVQKADLGDKGVFYRVQAGPLSAADATTICAKIKAAKGDCIIAK